MNNIQRLFCAIALLSSLACAWNQRGLADCGGLFLLDQTDQSFSVFRCNATDSIIKNNIMVYGGYGFVQGNAAWNNDWLLEWKKKDHYGQGGFRGDSRYLSLAADFEFGQARESYSVTSGLKLPDSSFYASGSISRENNQIFNLTWTPEDSFQYIDTISGNWESNLLKKEFNLGMIYHQHHLYSSVSLMDSKRASLEDNHYSIRDSSMIYTGFLKYEYQLEKGRFSIQGYHLDLESYIYGLRKVEENTKRFLYIPLEIQYNEYWASFLYTHWDFRIGYGNLAIELPQDTRRFYETLSPNRALDNSITQVVSFSFYQRNYRITGNMDAYWLDARASYSSEKQIKRWHWKRILGFDFFRVQGDMSVIKTSESSNIFGGTSYNEDIMGRFTFVGTHLKIGSRLESPERKIYFDITLGQIIPFYFHHQIKEIKTEKLVQKYDSKEGHETQYKPFRDGFDMRVQLGFIF